MRDSVGAAPRRKLAATWAAERSFERVDDGDRATYCLVYARVTFARDPSASRRLFVRIRRPSLVSVSATGVVLAATALLTGLLAPSAAAASFPVQPNIVSAALVAAGNPEQSPPGTNNFACKPSTTHPFTVVLIPGTFSVMEDYFGALAPTLANNGYCVFSLNYGGTAGSL